MATRAAGEIRRIDEDWGRIEGTEKVAAPLPGEVAPTVLLFETTAYAYQISRGSTQSGGPASEEPRRFYRRGLSPNPGRRPAGGGEGSRRRGWRVVARERRGGPRHGPDDCGNLVSSS